MNKGRDFEAEIKHSCEKQGLFCHKIADVYIPAQKALPGVFVPKQPCDFIMAFMGFTWFIEAKSTKEKYITFAKDSDSKGMLQYHQWVSLDKFNKYDDVKCGLLVQFENETDSPFTYLWPISGFMKFINETEKRSFNKLDVIQHDGIIMEQKKLITNWAYNIKRGLKEMSNYESQQETA